MLVYEIICILIFNFDFYLNLTVMSLKIKSIVVNCNNLTVLGQSQVLNRSHIDNK